MKPCAYCRRENSDEAVVCCECGTSLAMSEPLRAPRPPIPWREIPSNPVYLFLALVVGSTLGCLIWWCYPLVGWSLLSVETQTVLSWQGTGARFVLPEKVSWLFVLLMVAVSFGLWSFSRAARVVFTALLGFGFFTGLLGGMAVDTALGATLSWLTVLADGAILYAAYATPLKEKFE
jgi:hypothetical protein